MTSSTTAGRGLAIAAGGLFASGALAVLLDDSLSHGAPWMSLKHFLTLVTVGGTMMAGHLADQARRHRHIVSCIGFSLVFVAGTGLVVYSSVGRQTEASMLTAAEHDAQVGQRVALEAALASDRVSVAEKRADADKECASGEGPRCRSARSTVEFYENSAKGTEARLALMAPPKPVAPEAEKLGEVAVVFGYDKDKVKAAAVLVAPFFLTLFLEFGSIVSFGFAFSPKRTRRTAIDQPNVRRDREQTSFPGDELPDPRWFGDQEGPERANSPANPGGGPKVRRYTKDEAAADLVTRLALGERFESQDAMRERYGVAKSTMSDWLREFEDQGLIPARRTIGRCKALEQA